MTDTYIRTHWDTWQATRSPESIWRIASAKNWLTPEEEQGDGSELTPDRLQALAEEAQKLIVDRGSGR